jgi:hypothetical protein
MWFFENSGNVWGSNLKVVKKRLKIRSVVSTGGSAAKEPKGLGMTGIFEGLGLAELLC